MLIEDMYKLILKNNKLSTVLQSNGISLDTAQLIDITELEPTNPYKEIGINRGFKNHEGVQMFRVNPAHNLDLEMPFDTCFIKWADMVLPDEEHGEMYFLIQDNPSDQRTFVLAATALSTKGIMDVQAYICHNKEGYVFTIPNALAVSDEKLTGYLLDMLVQCIATMRKCNKRDANLFVTLPSKGKGVKIRGKFKDISDKPIYIYTKKTVNITKAQAFTRGQKVEACCCWPVRGHWRRLNSTKKRGKNPEGSYVVEGMTWVKPSVRGNKDLPLKTRVYIAKE